MNEREQDFAETANDGTEDERTEQPDRDTATEPESGAADGEQASDAPELPEPGWGADAAPRHEGRDASER